MSPRKLPFSDEVKLSGGSSDRGEWNPLSSASQSDEKNVERQPVKVLYIAGFGRSGSTLLDRLLGGASRLHSGGEIGGSGVRALSMTGFARVALAFLSAPSGRRSGAPAFLLCDPMR